MSGIGPDFGKDPCALAPVYFSQLYVHKDSKYFHFHQLQDATLAYNDETSLSGFHCLKFYIREYFLHTSMNESHDLVKISLPFFNKIVRSGAHAKSVQFVVNGKADALCLDENVKRAMSESADGKKLLEVLRPIAVPPLIQIIRETCYSNEDYLGIRPLSHHVKAENILNTADGRLGPNPSQPILASKRLSPKLQRKVTDAFLKLSAEKYDFPLSFSRVDCQNYLIIQFFMQDRRHECAFLPHIFPSNGFFQ